MSAYAGSLHTICRVVFWVFRFDQILVIALYFALHFDQIPSCTQYRRNLFYFQASNEFQPFFNTDQLSCRPSRWAYNSWNRNPFEKTDFGNWPAGDCYLVYPGNLSSLRFEKLRDGLEEFEKVNILRARAAKNPKAKAAVARMDEELSKLFTVEKSRGNSHEEDVRKAREIIRKTTEISR